MNYIEVSYRNSGEIPDKYKGLVFVRFNWSLWLYKGSGTPEVLGYRQVCDYFSNIPGSYKWSLSSRNRTMGDWFFSPKAFWSHIAEMYPETEEYALSQILCEQ